MSVPNFSSPACLERLSRMGGGVEVEIGYIAKLSPAKLGLRLSLAKGRNKLRLAVPSSSLDQV